MVERWTQTFHDKLDSFQGPPPDFISQFPVSQDGFPRGGRALMRYKALMDPQNTPFRWLSTIPVYGVTLRNNVASPYLELSLIQNSSFPGSTLFHFLVNSKQCWIFPVRWPTIVGQFYISVAENPGNGMCEAPNVQKELNAKISWLLECKWIRKYTRFKANQATECKLWALKVIYIPRSVWIFFAILLDQLVTLQNQ